MFKKEDFVCRAENSRAPGHVLKVNEEAQTCEVLWFDSKTTESFANLRIWEAPVTRELSKIEYQVFLERLRQKKKWTLAHDDEHDNEELAAVASSLAHPLTHFRRPCGCREAWCEHMGFREEWSPPAPEWARGLFVKNDRRQCLIVAAALLIAEVERLDRKKEKASRPDPNQALREEGIIDLLKTLEGVASCCLDNPDDARTVENLLIASFGFIPSEAEALVRQQESLGLDDEEDRKTFARSIRQLQKLKAIANEG